MPSPPRPVAVLAAPLDRVPQTSIELMQNAANGRMWRQLLRKQRFSTPQQMHGEKFVVTQLHYGASKRGQSCCHDPSPKVSILVEEFELSDFLMFSLRIFFEVNKSDGHTHEGKPYLAPPFQRSSEREAWSGVAHFPASRCGPSDPPIDCQHNIHKRYRIIKVYDTSVA